MGVIGKQLVSYVEYVRTTGDTTSTAFILYRLKKQAAQSGHVRPNEDSFVTHSHRNDRFLTSQQAPRRPCVFLMTTMTTCALQTVSAYLSHTGRYWDRLADYRTVPHTKSDVIKLSVWRNYGMAVWQLFPVCSTKENSLFWPTTCSNLKDNM